VTERYTERERERERERKREERRHTADNPDIKTIHRRNNQLYEMLTVSERDNTHTHTRADAYRNRDGRSENTDNPDIKEIHSCVEVKWGKRLSKAVLCCC
jgi:hypothetical protein